MSLCFVKMEEMANIDLSVSIIDDEEQTAAVCIQPKQSVQRERYDVRKTNNPRVCPTETLFVWFTRLREHFQQSPTNFIHLFQTENWEQADHRYTSARLERLVLTLGVKGATANSKDTHLLQNQLHRNLMGGQQMEQDSKASALVKNHDKKQASQIISKQCGGARVFEGDLLQQSPLGDDLQLPPQETPASPFSFPIISSQPIVEAESPNDRESAKVQKSQVKKDDQDMEPQGEAQDSSMTKDSDRAATGEAQK
ncbi:MAG: hypothetical protein EZS28_008324 [Streblomastix strix]|uniref:Uncharacterized protein n=1 Tax=Streblomastix strix TaxID=222440 RepID=A0A5J4WPM3_9EUKA|nr:MAG: hypothetical protein EZS28_008324 [Streblomastix strix]